jgi:hypothetical protein
VCVGCNGVGPQQAFELTTEKIKKGLILAPCEIRPRETCTTEVSRGKLRW